MDADSIAALDGILSGVSFASNKTPQEQSFLKSLSEELDKRTAEGDINLTIKYINGTPRIVSNKKTKLLQRTNNLSLLSECQRAKNQTY